MSTLGETIGKHIDEALEERVGVGRWAGHRNCGQLMYFIAEMAIAWSCDERGLDLVESRELAALRSRGALLRYALEAVDNGARVEDVAALIARLRGKTVFHPSFRDKTAN